MVLSEQTNKCSLRITVGYDICEVHPNVLMDVFPNSVL